MIVKEGYGIPYVLIRTNFNIDTKSAMLSVKLIFQTPEYGYGKNGADKGDKLKSNIKENRLKTDGSFRFVRNPRYSTFLLVEFGLALVCHNLYLLIIPVLFWIEMTIVLKHTEEKWLTELYGQEYIEYCKKVNRCIPFFPK